MRDSDNYAARAARELLTRRGPPEVLVRRVVVEPTPFGPVRTGQVFVRRGPLGGPFETFEETREP